MPEGEDWPKAFGVLSESQRKGFTLEVTNRQAQIRLLIRFLNEHREGLIESLQADYLTRFGAEVEVQQVIEQGERMLEAFPAWTRGKRVSTGLSLLQALDRASVHYDPLGVVLIIGTWNVPLLTVFDPLFGAIAAGCCAFVKPSELSEHTSEYLRANLPAYLNPQCVVLATGGAEGTGRLVAEHGWDMIFFTGGPRVGRLIYAQAAAKMIPCVLELGGKSPVIVDGNLDGGALQHAADRIVWGKILKAGQTCIAPDYLLVEEKVYDRFLGCLLTALRRMLGPQRQSPDLDAIISKAHWSRIASLLDSHQGRVVFEAPRSLEDRYFGPVLIAEPHSESSLMKEEIFGPLLPVLKVRNIQEAIEFVNDRPKPLILYAFSKDTKVIEEIQRRTRSGNFLANDVILSFTADMLPFGGVGASGLGCYHGRKTFEAFSHAKSCLQRPLALPWIDEWCRFPPYTEEKTKRSLWVAFHSRKTIKIALRLTLGVFILCALVLGIVLPLST